MRACWLACWVACWVACTHALHLGTAHASLGEGEDVELTAPEECDWRQRITVHYERQATTRDANEVADFVGLFSKDDFKSTSPFDVVAVGTSARSGDLTLVCRRTGDMELRMVRAPGNVLGSAGIQVFPKCADPTCSGHGSCVRGRCECEGGWNGDACELIAKEGLTLGWVGNPDGEFYPGMTIHAKFYHTVADAESSGSDMVGIYANGATMPLRHGFVEQGKSEVEIPVPGPGEYTLKLKRGADGQIVASSEAFSVFEPCKNYCSYRGTCQRGKCVCEPEFDRSDCSRGPGVVLLSQPKDTETGTLVDVDFTRDETIPGVLSARDFIGVYQADDKLTDNPVVYAYAIAKHVRDPDVGEMKNKSVGTVHLQMPREAGRYVVRYVRQDYAKYNETAAFTVYAPCPRQCSEHGECELGICKCSGGWKGDACEVSEAEFALELAHFKEGTDLHVGDSIYVKWTRPIGKNTNNDYVGVYDASSKLNSEGLSDYAYAVADPTDPEQPSQTGMVKLDLTVVGTVVVRYVDVYSQQTEAELSKELTVYPRCPAECSGHGTCNRGTCECSAAWTGKSCAVGAGPIVVTVPGNKVTLKTGETGFVFHVTRPTNTYTGGDLIAMFVKGAPNVLERNLGFAYASWRDDQDMYLEARMRRQPGEFELRYLNPSHEVLATSDPFTIEFSDQ